MVILAFKDAKDSGLARYFTGKTCPHGHVSERFVSSRACVECAGILKKKWAVKNQDHVRAYEREYTDANREKKNVYNRSRRMKNPEKTKAYKKAEYLRTKEKHLARCKKYALENKEKIQKATRAKRKAKPAQYNAYARNYKLRKRGAIGKHTGAEILEILKLQRGKCACCKIKLGKKYHVDHIIPLIRNGSNDRRNLQILCAPCNHSKSGKDPIKFMQQKGMLL